MSQADHRIVRATLDSLSAQIALVDASGEIFLTNEAWRGFARATGTPPREVSEGVNYLDVCDAAGRAGSEEAAAFAEGLRSVLGGRLRQFSMEYPCHSPTEDCWFVARATRFLAVAGRLRGCLRTVDTAARLGGDEFVVVLEGVGDEEEALALAERIARALGEPYSFGGAERTLAASMGVALSTDHHGDPEELLRSADLAMYRSKRGGKSRVSLHGASS